MKCPNCGNENPDGERFCKKCETPVHPFERMLWDEIQQMYAANNERLGIALKIAVSLTGFTLLLTGLANATDFEFHPSSGDWVLMIGGLALPIGLWFYWRRKKNEANETKPTPMEPGQSLDTKGRLTAFYFTIVLSTSIAGITFITNGLIEADIIHKGLGAGVALAGTGILWLILGTFVGLKYLRPMLK